MRRKEIDSGTFDYSCHQRGFSTLAWLVAMPMLLISLLVLTVIFFEGRKAYWDAQLEEMCEKDKGVEILERVILTKQEAQLMPRVDGKIATKSNASGAARDPVYSERKISNLRESNPRVSREDVVVIRRSDQRIVARWVEYVRVGGDMPTGLAHHSSFRCPDSKERLEELRRLFVIQGDKP